MKKYKILISIALTLALALSLSLNVIASDPDETGGFVDDGADILTDHEEKRLESKIADFREKNGFDLYIVTVRSVGSNTMSGYANRVYSGGEDGILLLMEYVYGGSDNEFWIEAFGYGEYAFNSYGITYIEDDIVDYLGDEDFYDGFAKFVTLADDFIREAREGEPYSESNKRITSGEIALTFGIILAVSIAIGLITVLIMAYKMNNARPKKLAHEYIKQGSFRLNVSRDLFLYSTVSRTRRSNSSSSGGGSSSRGSSGGRRF